MPTVTQHNFGTRTTSPPEAAFTSLGTDPDTTNGAFCIFIDLNAMASGDTVVIQEVEKATGSGDTQRVVWEKTYTGVQEESGMLSPILPVLHGWTFKLKQTAGSARSYPWSIRKVGA
jgi:hypothetical protein